MSLHPLAGYRVPEGTARVAHAAFPKGNLYLMLRDELGPIYEDRAFAALFATRGRPAIAPAQLALVTVLQFAEGLSDKQAADAVRARIDWKYVLSLELEDPGFDASVLKALRDLEEHCVMMGRALLSARRPQPARQAARRASFPVRAARNGSCGSEPDPSDPRTHKESN